MVYGKKMRFRFVLIMMLLRPGGVPGAELRLRSGERIRGEVEALGSQEILIRPLWSRDRVTVPLEALSTAVWPEDSPTAGPGDTEFWFRNGDRFTGVWEGLQGDILMVKTPWGQRVRIQKEAMAEIRSASVAGQTLMREPSQGTPWVFRDPRATGVRPEIEAGVLRLHAASGVTARTALPPLPSRFVFEVEARPQTEFFMYTMNLMGRGLNTRGPGNINLQVNSHGITVSTEGHEHGDSRAWRDRMPESALSEQRFTLWVDLDNEVLVVDLNEVRLATLKLPGASERIGERDRSFSVQVQAGDRDMEFSGIRLRQRAGNQLPRSFGGARADRDQVFMLDGRRIEGALRSAGEDEVRIHSGRDVQVLPRSEVAAVVFGPGEIRSGNSPCGLSVRTRVAPGRVTVRPTDTAGPQLLGRVQGWMDEAQIPFTALFRLENLSDTDDGLRTGADEIHLLNGDRIFGTLESLEGNTFQLRRPGGEPPVRIPGAYVGQIRRHEGPVQVERSADVRLEYVNGDRLSGRFLGMDAERVVVETVWGQHLRSRRDAVQRIVRIPAGRDLLWRGPGDLQEWTLQTFGPSVRSPAQAGGTIALSGMRSAARGMPPVPDRFEIVLKMRMEGGFGDFRADFFAAGTPESPLGGLSVYNRGTQIEVAGSFPSEGQTIYLREEAAALMASHRRDIRLIGDLGRGEVWLEFNGTALGRWMLSDPGALRMQPERLMQIQVRSPFLTLYLEDLLFSRFPHVLPGPEDRKRDGLGGDVILFSNGDRLSAEITGGHSGEVKVQTEEQHLSLPLSRLQSITLNPDSMRLPRRSARDIRVFHAGTKDRLTFALHTLDGETITGRGDLWLEDLHLPRSSFRVAVMNVHTPVRFDEAVEKESE